MGGWVGTYVWVDCVQVAIHSNESVQHRGDVACVVGGEGGGEGLVL